MIGKLALFAALLWAVAGIVEAATPTISTYAYSFIPAGGSQVTLSQPGGVATDAAGTVYVADTGSCIVWEFPNNGQQPFALAGQRGNCAGSYASSNPTLDSLNHPVDVAVCNGTVYIADTASAAATGLHAVTGGVFSNVVLHYTATHGIVGVAQPQAIACDNAGDLYVESVYNSTDQNGPSYTLDTLTAGGITLNVGQEFDIVYQGVAVDANGNVYTTRSNVGGLGPYTSIAKFTETSVSPNYVWSETVLSLNRYLNGPTRIALDAQGNFYVNEAAPVAAGSPLGPTVYVSEISSAGAVSYLAGNGTPGFSGDGGAPLSAELYNVSAIAPGSIIYVADTGNNRVRQFYSATSSLVETDKIPNFSLQTAVNPVTHQLYVAVSRGNYTQGGPVSDIVVYNTVDDTVVANIPVGAVGYMVVDTMNNVIYASTAGNTVTVIDGATNTVDATIAVGGAPGGIAVDPALNMAYVANTESTFVSVIHGPVRTSGVITAPAYSLTSENIGSILPLGAIDVDLNSHAVYAIVAGPSNAGSETYALAIISGGAVTNTVSYLVDAGSTDIAANALAVDQHSGLVVIADTADQNVTVYNPQSGALQAYGQSFYPNNIAMDSVNEIAYASTGYGNVTQISLPSGGQRIVNTPVFPAASGDNCGYYGTAVAVDPSQLEAYFTTCDAANGVVLTLWNAAAHTAVSKVSIAGFNSVYGDFAVAVDSSRHVAYVSNSTVAGEIDAINGPAAPATPQLTLSVNGGAAQPLNAASNVAFGSIAVGQSGAPQTFTVTDTGAAAASVPPPVVLGGNFSNTGSTCAAGTLLAASGGTCSTTIAFSPSTNVALIGGLAFFDNERDTPQLIGLTGTGTGTHFLTVSPSSIPAGYVGLPYAPSGFPVQFSSPNASGGASLNICATQTGPTTSPPDTSVCCPVGGYYSIGPPMSCPTGLLPPNMSWFEPDLSAGTGSITTTGTYSFSVVATDPSGDYGWTNYTLVIEPMFTLSFGLSAPSVTGGSSVTATVTLSQAAPAGGAYVFLNSSNTAYVNSTVATVSAGMTIGTVTLTTSAVTVTEPVSITATYDGSNAVQTLTLMPPAGPPAPSSITVMETISVSDTSTFPDLVVSETIMVTDAVMIGATVPNVVGDVNGTAAGDAGAILATAGLTVGTVTYVTSTSVPAGTVISQSPGSNTTETPGEAINLVVSSGLPQVIVPNVVNDTLAQVAIAFAPGGLGNTITNGYSSTVTAGSVISQVPVGGTSVTYGSSVALVLSKGPAPVSLTVPESITTTDTVSNLPVPVPDVLGEPLATATTNLQSAGFTVTSSTQPNSLISLGSVISQSLPGGSSAAAGAIVSLVVSSGPPTVVVALNGAPVIASTAAGWSVTVTLHNTGNVTATVSESSATLGGIAQSAAVSPITALAPGTSGSFVLSFPAAAGTVGTSVPFKVNGSYSATALSGNWSVSLRGVELP